jgi:hypothetical protein
MESNHTTQKERTMTTAELTEQAKNYKGTEFTANTLGVGMKVINELLRNGTIKVIGKTNSGNARVYQVC